MKRKIYKEKVVRPDPTQKMKGAVAALQKLVAEEDAKWKFKKIMKDLDEQLREATSHFMQWDDNDFTPRGLEKRRIKWLKPVDRTYLGKEGQARSGSMDMLLYRQRAANGEWSRLGYDREIRFLLRLLDGFLSKEDRAYLQRRLTKARQRLNNPTPFQRALGKKRHPNTRHLEGFDREYYQVMKTVEKINQILKEDANGTL